MVNTPIGFFDSGIGGLTIWKEVVALLPYESTIYLSDNANAPYGSKSYDSLLERCFSNTEFLLEKGCKLIVVACNTATTQVIDTLRENYDALFVGVEPPIKPAALATKTGTIGLLATEATLQSPLLLKTANQYLRRNVRLIKQHGKGLVRLIELGEIKGENIRRLLQGYLHNIIRENADYLVLGCTHYPLLKPLITKITEGNIAVIDSGLPVAKRVAYLLEKHPLQEKANTHSHHFYATGALDILKETMKSVTPYFLPFERFFFSSFA